MSWQPYVENNMVGTGNMGKAAIHGLDGNVWATSPGFTMDPAVVRNICSTFKSNPDGFANGSCPIIIEGEKFMFLRADTDPSSTVKYLNARFKGSGATIAVTNQCFLIGVCTETVGSPGVCSTTVTKLADYLIGVGY